MPCAKDVSLTRQSWQTPTSPSVRCFATAMRRWQERSRVLPCGRSSMAPHLVKREAYRLCPHFCPTVLSCVFSILSIFYSPYGWGLVDLLLRAVQRGPSQAARCATRGITSVTIAHAGESVSRQCLPGEHLTALPPFPSLPPPHSD